VARRCLSRRLAAGYKKERQQDFIAGRLEGTSPNAFGMASTSPMYVWYPCRYFRVARKHSGSGPGRRDQQASVLLFYDEKDVEVNSA
jgi:hypothetical protein